MEAGVNFEPSDHGEQVEPHSYLSATRSPTYGYLAALPLILLYEIMIVTVNDDPFRQVRVGAEVWMKQVLALVGETGVFVLGIAVLLAGIGVLVADRQNRPPLRMSWLGGLVAESAVYAFVVALGVSTVVGLIFSLIIPSGTETAVSLLLQDQNLMTNLALSIGAGVYEELLFRVILVGGLFWLLSAIGLQKVTGYIIAAVAGALIFSAVHYVGALGDVFTLPSFTFRFLFGLVLNGIFLTRGFGVAAWTHAIYDILIVTGMLG